MTFLAPAFAWAFLSLGVILFLYLLRRRYEDKPVPSTFLWRQTVRDLTASRPFQRLRRNLLLPLHLLMAAVLSLLLMQPVLPGKAAGEVVMIFDLSASMQAETNGRTRLDDAVEEALRRMDGMDARAALTILTSGGETRQLLARSTDREAARRVLRSLRPTCAAGDLSGAVSLALAMRREMPGLNILVFSDEYVSEEAVSVWNAPAGLDNRAVLSFAVENGAGYARVANYGAECVLTLACYAQDQLCDARTLRIPAGESAGVSFDVPACEYASVEIQEQDAIAADNRLFFVPKTHKTYTVALSGDSSVFLEQALALRGDAVLVKTTDEERAAVTADLYVYGTSPLFFSRDAEQTEISFGEERTAQGGPALAERDALTAGLSLSDVAVRAFRPLQGGRALMTLDGQNVLSAAERTVALGFALNDSNLPLKYDFPILVQNVLSQLLPETAADVGEGLCGETVRLALPVDGTHAAVVTPDGQTVQAAEGADWHSEVLFDATGAPGLYALDIEGGAQAGRRYFSLRMPAGESDVRRVAPGAQEEGGLVAAAAGRGLTGWLLGLFLLLLLVEWGVSRRGA